MIISSRTPILIGRAQLDIICVELALAVVNAGQTRYELLGLIAAGEYPLHSLYHTASRPVVSFFWSYAVSMPYWVM